MVVVIHVEPEHRAIDLVVGRAVMIWEVTTSRAVKPCASFCSLVAGAFES